MVEGAEHPRANHKVHQTGEAWPLPLCPSRGWRLAHRAQALRPPRVPRRGGIPTRRLRPIGPGPRLSPGEASKVSLKVEKCAPAG